MKLINSSIKFICERPVTIHPPSLAEHAQLLRTGELRAIDLFERCQHAYQQSEPQLNAYKSWNSKRGPELATLADDLLRQGIDLGPLMGIPVSVKDLYGVPGLPIFAGSAAALPASWESAGPIIAQLQKQLGIITGKTHTVEFAFGGLGANAHWGTPWNPWSPASHRVPGGSSSGAGVSLVQGSALLALGTDTAGSVRIPAAMTGQAALKLTHGRWSATGLVPLSTTFDSPGLLARNVADLSFAFRALDTEPRPAFTALATHSLKGLRIGVPRNFFWEGGERSVCDTIEQRIQRLAAAGAEVIEIDLAGCEQAYALFTQGGLAASELAAFLQQHFPERHEQLDPVVRARVAAAQQISSVEYLRRKQLFQHYAQLASARFAQVDVIATPTIVITPPQLVDIADPERYRQANMMVLRNTVIANLFGWCALSMPVGLDAHRMPIGLQLMMPAMAEEQLLAVGCAIEQLIGSNRELLGPPPDRLP